MWLRAMGIDGGHDGFAATALAGGDCESSRAVATWQRDIAGAGFELRAQQHAWLARHGAQLQVMRGLSGM